MHMNTHRIIWNRDTLVRQLLFLRHRGQNCANLRSLPLGAQISNSPTSRLFAIRHAPSSISLTKPASTVQYTTVGAMAKLAAATDLNLSTGGEIPRVNSVKVGEPSTKQWWQYRTKFLGGSKKKV